MAEFSRRKFVALGGGALGGAVAGVAGGPAPAEAAVPALGAAAAVPGGGAEPDIELAKLWWPDPRNLWAPIGWKDSLFRFNVVYNGSVIAAPRSLGRYTTAVEGYGGQGIQLDMNPWGGWFNGPGPLNPLYPSNFYVYRDDYGLYGHGTQRWAANPTPVLQTDWPQSNGVVLRQSVFAHALDGADVVRGDEPLFAWVRLSVAYVNPLDSPQPPIGFAIRVCRPYYFQQYPYKYQDGVTLTGDPSLAPFPDGRWTAATSRPGQTGYKVWQPQGPRLAVLTSHAVPTFTRPDTSKWIYSIQVQLPPVVGAHTDILVSMLPAYEPNLDREIALGYDGALADADRYWSRRPATAATVDTPEPHVNEAIRRNIQFSEVVTQKSPATGQATFLTGSYGYDVLWSTPTSMTSHMFLDLLGYHDTVARHIDLYRTGQGSTDPPGPAYPRHPGYYGTPIDLKAVNWITDHGAVMEIVARHALLTGDQAFITTWRDSLEKACVFVKDACENQNHTGIKGLPPPAIATDEEFHTQSVWNMAWIYKGFTSTIELFRQIGHPRAEEFAGVAASLKSVFVAAFDDYGTHAPKWTHPNGQQYPVYSPNLIPPDSGGFGEIIRLDAGPLVLVWAGLFDAADDRMAKFADYFRYGPNITLYGTGNRKNALDRPVLVHEMSSCEPIYSWNVFGSWQTADRARFLEGMYSLLAGGLSPQTYVPFEHRHGMSAMPGPNATAFWLVRHAVLDDSIAGGELHLLRLCPLAWLAADRDTVFGAMPTLFGPVSLRFRRGSGTALTLTWSGSWRRTPAKVVVHAPPGITQLVVNGTSYAVPPSGQVEVPSG